MKTIEDYITIDLFFSIFPNESHLFKIFISYEIYLFSEHKNRKLTQTANRIKNMGSKCVNCERESYYLVRGFIKNRSCPIDRVFSKDLIRITIDHIIPKSKGGKNNHENLQVMCESCNTKKGNKII